MDFFGWSTQSYAAEPCLPSRPSDDDDNGLLSAVLCTSLHNGLYTDHSSLAAMSSSSQTIPILVQGHDGTSDLPDSGTPAGTLPNVMTNGAVEDDDLFDAFAYVVPNFAEGSAQAAASNLSGYGSSSTTGGGNGNISSGESNTCGGGGQDVEVASPCSVSQQTLIRQTPTTARTKATAMVRGAAGSTSSSTSRATFRGQQIHSHHHHQTSSSGGMTLLGRSGYQPADAEAIARAKESIYRAAAMRPVHQLVISYQNTVKPRRRKNVRISSDPQTVAARLRRERISERLRALQRLVPGGCRMDTASMLDEAASYLRFLKSQIKALESWGGYCNGGGGGSLLQNYCTGNRPGHCGGGGSINAVLAFGSRDDGIVGGYTQNLAREINMTL